jgi:hypothetical protein
MRTSYRRMRSSSRPAMLTAASPLTAAVVIALGLTLAACCTSTARNVAANPGSGSSTQATTAASGSTANNSTATPGSRVSTTSAGEPLAPLGCDAIPLSTP